MMGLLWRRNGVFSKVVTVRISTKNVVWKDGSGCAKIRQSLRVESDLAQRRALILMRVWALKLMRVQELAVGVVESCQILF
jgi:hypothetical protein